MTPPEHLPKTRTLWSTWNAGVLHAIRERVHQERWSRVPILVGATALNSSSQEWLAFVLDLSDLKRVEAELHTSHEELEQESRGAHSGAYRESSHSRIEVEAGKRKSSYECCRLACLAFRMKSVAILPATARQYRANSDHSENDATFSCKPYRRGSKSSEPAQ